MYDGKECGFDRIYKDIFINLFEFRILTNLEHLRDTFSSALNCLEKFQQKIIHLSLQLFTFIQVGLVSQKLIMFLQISETEELCSFSTSFVLGG